MAVMSKSIMFNVAFAKTVYATVKRFNQSDMLHMPINLINFWRW